MKLFVICYYYCLLTCFEWILTVIWANKFVLVSTGLARTCTTLGLVTVDTYRQCRFLSGEKYRFLSDWENKNNKFVVHKLQTKKSALIPLVWTVWGKAACTSLSPKQCLSPCSGPTPMYLDMRTPMINLFKKLLGFASYDQVEKNSKCTSNNLLSPLGARYRDLRVASHKLVTGVRLCLRCRQGREKEIC